MVNRFLTKKVVNRGLRLSDVIWHLRIGIFKNFFVINLFIMQKIILRL